MNYKKILTITALMLLCVSLNAGPLRGFYLGTNIGARILTNSLESSNNSGAKNNAKKNSLGFSAGINTGYLKQLQDSKMVIGGEIAATAHLTDSMKGKLSYSGNASEGDFEVKHKFSLAGSLITGVFMNPKFLLYGKVGYGLNKVSMKFTNLQGDKPNNNSYNKFMKGPILGAGGLYTLTNHLLIGGEYTYHIVDAIEPRKGDTPQNSGIKRGFKYNAGIHSIAGKLIYVF